MKNLSTRELALSAALAALSATVQLIHIGYQSPQWGMWIDFVAVFWIIAFFLFGVRSSLLVSVLGAIVITLFAPDTWLGAMMKWTATLPLWACLFLYTRLLKRKFSDYQKISHLVLPVAAGIIIRCILIIPINYYFAIPIWTGMPPDKAMTAIPWSVIAGFNIVQGLLDIFIAWILVFKFKLIRYTSSDIQ